MLGFIFEQASSATSVLVDSDEWCRFDLKGQSDKVIAQLTDWLRENEDAQGPALLTSSSLALLRWALDETVGESTSNIAFAVTDRPDVLSRFRGIMIADAELQPVMRCGRIIDCWVRSNAREVLPSAGFDLREVESNSNFAPVLWDRRTPPPPWATASMLVSSERPVPAAQLIPLGSRTLEPSHPSVGEAVVQTIQYPAAVRCDHVMTVPEAPSTSAPSVGVAPAVPVSTFAKKGRATPTLQGDDRDLLTTAGAAEAVGVAEKTIRAWVKSGKLTAKYAGRLLRVERGELRRFLSSGAKAVDNKTGSVDLVNQLVTRARG